MFKSRLLVSAVALAALAGCEPTTEQLVKQGKPIEKVYPSKAGVTVGQMQNDFTDCEIEAAQRVPQQMTIGTTPTYTTPLSTQCVNNGYSVSCNTTGGQTYGGQTYSYDANAGLRGKAEAQCLIRSGYSLATIPKCPEGANVRPVLAQLYPLSTNTCYVSDAEGNYAFTEAVR